MSLFSRVVGLIFAFIALSTATLVTHDSTFYPDIILRITSEVISRDCEFRRSVVVNGTSPGPELRLKGGQTYWIRVYNDMADQNLTMHWHGIANRVAPFSDGSPQASQWPIPPLHYFDYELHPVEEEAGSYFYHSHVGFQAGTCAGPLIIEENGPPPFQYDEERMVFLSDYFNRSDWNISQGLIASPLIWSGETNSLIINSKSGTASNKTESCAPEVFYVEPEKTYRFRFIGSTALSLITLAFENHANLSIISADGQYTQSFSTPYLQVGTGQRYDVLLKTKSEADLKDLGKTDFWIQFENRERPEPMVRSYAILSYSSPGSSLPSIPTMAPLSLPETVYDFLEYSLQPLLPDASFPSASEVTRRIVIKAQQVINGPTVWHANSNMWTEELVQVPYLVNIYRKGQEAIPDYDAAMNNGGWDPESLAFPAKMGEVLEIIFENASNGKNGGWDFHPFHAHGGHYWDIGSGNGTYDPVANEEKLKGYHPVKRDTTLLYRYAASGVPDTTAGWRAWRLRVQYPGVWMIHCHILQHMLMGMQLTWVFGDADDILLRVPTPEVSGYLTFGGNVNGNDTHYPVVNHYFE